MLNNKNHLDPDFTIRRELRYFILLEDFGGSPIRDGVNTNGIWKVLEMMINVIFCGIVSKIHFFLSQGHHDNIF